MPKIKLSYDEFYKLYHEKTTRELSSILKVSYECISSHARRLGIKKAGTVGVFCSMKKNPKVIPGGLPEK